MDTIILKFVKSETRLAGFPYGETVYKEQVEPIINNSDKVEIVFPEQIEKVASSFVQGFFSKLVETIGYQGINEKIAIKSKSDKLTNSIMKNLY